LRDRWLAWPARVGPLLAAQFERDATAVTRRAGGVRPRAPGAARQRARRLL